MGLPVGHGRRRYGPAETSGRVMFRLVAAGVTRVRTRKARAQVRRHTRRRSQERGP
jgi:hypothetical protein